MFIHEVSSAAWVVLVAAGLATCAGCTSVYDEARTLLEGGGRPAGTGGAAGGTGGAAGTTGNTGASGSVGSGGASAGGGGVGGSRPVCGNGTVEIGEDCDDGNSTGKDGCSTACKLEGGSCGDTIDVEIDLVVALSFDGTTTGGATTSVACDKKGPHRIYSVKPMNDGFLTASLAPKAPAFNSTLYILETCGGEPLLACADGTTGEVASIEVTAGNPVYVVVGGVDAGDEGDYELTLDLSVGDDCSDPIPLRIDHGTGVDLRGSTIGKKSNGKCTWGTGAKVPDVVYRAQMVEAGDYVVTLEGDYDSVLHARTNCSGGKTEIACENVSVPFGAQSGEKLDVLVQDSQGDVAPGADIFVWVDGNQWAITSKGSYQLGIKLAP